MAAANKFTVKYGQMFVKSRALLLVLNNEDEDKKCVYTEFFYNDKGKLEPGFARELTDAAERDYIDSLALPPAHRLIKVESMNDGIALLQKNRRKLQTAARRLVKKVGPSGNNRFLTEYLSKCIIPLDVPVEDAAEGVKVYAIAVDDQRVTLSTYDGPTLVSVDRAVLANRKYNLMKCVTGANKELLAGILKNQLDVHEGTGRAAGGADDATEAEENLIEKWHKYINATQALKLKI